MTESDESMASTQTCPPTYWQIEQFQDKKYLKKQLIQNKYIVSTIRNTATRNRDAE